MLHYQYVKSCIRYQTYQFQLNQLTEQQHFLLKQFVGSLGNNANPIDFPVLHIKHSLFFIDFPSYGFPYFKLTFYKTTSPQEVEHYLNKTNDFLNQLLSQEEAT
ncbi:hypothetical protein [Candidatus Albibeggiatoa sp. nov. NOAA]|uniref:hypothetical protein n=1 Tax=Candidatus Albibeggiatoa sp. nov. NOAA TaxID=3162724 RepID=UPI0032FD2EC3|nr:hypothetical protein [Thiotrichaceae bacterium]